MRYFLVIISIYISVIFTNYSLKERVIGKSWKSISGLNSGADTVTATMFLYSDSISFRVKTTKGRDKVEVKQYYDYYENTPYFRIEVGKRKKMYYLYGHLINDSLLEVGTSERKIELNEIIQDKINFFMKFKHERENLR